MKLKSIIYFSLIISFTANLAFADIAKDYNEVFSVVNGGTLNLETDTGSVKIRSHASSELIVKVHVIADTRSESKAERWFDDFELRMTENNNDVTIVGELPSRFFRWNNKLQIRYDITIPQAYNIHLDTAGGSFDIGDIEGDVWLRTSGGSIKLGNILGKVLAHTSGGSISTESVKGDLDISTSGGSLNLKNISGNVHGRTSGGSIKAEILTQVTEPVELKTSGGSIVLSVPADLNANLDASTSGGRISTELPILVSGKIGSSSLQGALNDGGIPIVVHTSGGSIVVKAL